VNLSRVALEAQLFEADLARVLIGAPVRVTTDALPNRTFTGRLGFIGSRGRSSNAHCDSARADR
jgi:multidrug resistance efflux pump